MTMNEVESSRPRTSRRGSNRRLDASSSKDQSSKFELSFSDLAMSRAAKLRGPDQRLGPSNRMETFHESPSKLKVKESPREEKKLGRTTRKVRGSGQKTIGDMFVEDDFGAVSFGDDGTTTSATTATTKSSAAKIVPVKVESTLDMDPFANIDYGVGFSDWNYSSKDSASSAAADKAKASKSRRRSSMSNVPSDYHAVQPKEEPKEEHRRRSRRSSLDLALQEEDKPSRRRGDVSVSSGVSAKSNGSRGSRSSSDDKHSRREGSRDDKARGDRRPKMRSDRRSRRRLSMGATKVVEEHEFARLSASEEQHQETQPRRMTKRASLNMVAGNGLPNTDPPRRNARRASLNMDGKFQSAFVSDSPCRSGVGVQAWDDDGFEVIK